MTPDRIHEWEVDPPAFEEDWIGYGDFENETLDHLPPCYSCGSIPCYCSQIEDYINVSVSNIQEAT